MEGGDWHGVEGLSDDLEEVLKEELTMCSVSGR